MANLTDRAMLIRLTITQWTARKHDKGVSQEVADNHNSAVDMGRFNKALVDKGALKPVVTAAGALRNYLYEQTLPWKDEGARLLPAANYWPFTVKVRELRQAFDEAVADFLGAYDRHVEDARGRLGTLFAASDYPTRAAIERRFGTDIDFSPMPDAKDFRVDLGDIEVSKITREIEARSAAAIEDAHRSLWDRCHNVVAAMVDRLNAYDRDSDGKAVHPFRDSLVGNIRDLCDLLPRLNIVDDPEMERLRARMLAELAPHDPAELRDAPVLRESVAAAAADILADMQGYCGIDQAAE